MFSSQVAHACTCASVVSGQHSLQLCRNGIWRRPARCATTLRATERSDDAEMSQTSGGLPSGITKFYRSSAKDLQVPSLVDELKENLASNQRGEAWFLAQAALLFALLFPPGPVEVLVRGAGVVAAVLGVVLAAAGQQSLGNSLSPFPAPRRKEDHDLITDGIYSYTRYGGVLLLAFGLSAATGSDLRFVTSFALFYVLSKKVELEEAALIDRYGDEYDSYRKRPDVKRFIPWIL